MTPRPLSILIVSPDRDTLRRLSKFLEAFGYGVRQASDSQQALAAAQAAQPDFLILDASTDSPVDLQLCRQTRRLWPDGYTVSMLLAQGPEVADVTTALEAGFDDFLAVPIVFGELLARLRAGARIVEFERRLSEQAGLEPITGLPDKGSLAAEFQDRAASGGILALVDFDYFTRFGDRFGRLPAESLLRQAADILRAKCLPAASMPQAASAFAASLGGDQIAVLLPPGVEAASAWAEALLAALAGQQFEISGQPTRLTASCGLTETVAGDSLEAAVGRAQKALALAKASGRNAVATTAEVDLDSAAWASFAADGKLFQTTLARDVMQPCPLVLHQDEPVEQAQAILERTSLTAAPVVDGEGRLAGLVSLDQLTALHSKANGKPRSGNSVRLVRHVMTSDVARFEEATPLANLLEFFTGEGGPLAIVQRDRRPRGIVHCHGLAALNEKLAAGHFARTRPRTGNSSDLLVPELAAAE
jgi:diguanylate cyclase (GGDEF)-like protein